MFHLLNLSYCHKVREREISNQLCHHYGYSSNKTQWNNLLKKDLHIKITDINTR